MVAITPLILLTLNFLGFTDGLQCYRCVSPYIIDIWNQVNLTRMNPGDEVMGTSKCLNASMNIETVRCSECGLLKVYGVINHEEYLFGVMRDCGSSRSFRKLKSQVNEDQADSFESIIPSRKTSRTLHFRICHEDYCNGQKRKSNFFSPNSSFSFYSGYIQVVFPLFLTFVKVL
ncbi:unnamed protein product [Bursaphelenchus xylophilus]|uniref:(pine wood nematode) hypothetical protein n=1 Tax=Bursaphelenchus xylophilus TaxID=6326 RepID=A0A1I7RRS8_BURXY|nr:unnamed protein product [Bursaphelenchus xylophilus]CAG9123500.1 unnamed protein product [Bursaphelenchus xylophilus]